uniref:Uncharacterized protein n=1 Tax=Anguilla anguilla TaxID=7936 RepID=A0A0E9PZI5_ANGAN
MITLTAGVAATLPQVGGEWSQCIPDFK